jgi:hypothetical protein
LLLWTGVRTLRVIFQSRRLWLPIGVLLPRLTTRILLYNAFLVDQNDDRQQWPSYAHQN